MKIMLDAGHGYQTQGKGVPGLKEYEFNKATVNHMINLLNQYQNVEIHCPHNDTRDVPLKERTNQANNLKVDGYVSVHANAGAASARGIETYIYTRTDKATDAMGLSIHNHLINTTGMRNRGLKRADFHVLRETHMKAVLVECGFMTNPEDLKLLLSDEYRRKCAQGIVNGLVEHFGLVKKPVPKPTPTPQSAPSNAIYKVQVGAFKDKANADKLVEELKAKGYSAIVAH